MAKVRSQLESLKSAYSIIIKAEVFLLFTVSINDVIICTSTVNLKGVA